MWALLSALRYRKGKIDFINYYSSFKNYKIDIEGVAKKRSFLLAKFTPLYFVCKKIEGSKTLPSFPAVVKKSRSVFQSVNLITATIFPKAG